MTEPHALIERAKIREIIADTQHPNDDYGIEEALANHFDWLTEADAAALIDAATDGIMALIALTPAGAGLEQRLASAYTKAFPQSDPLDPEELAVLAGAVVAPPRGGVAAEPMRFGPMGWPVLTPTPTPPTAAGGKILDGLTEALAHSRGDQTGAQEYVLPTAAGEPTSIASVWAQAKENHARHSYTGSVEEDIRFLTLGLVGEAGELANFVKKRWRDGDGHDQAMRWEVADVCAYAFMLADVLGMTPGDLIATIAEKQQVFLAKMEARNG